ncbi:hypothetical protein FC97_GL000013 [Companilactobacillus kimchii DSM 13961 = JCM 10707]|uniref:Uncharacterized protein n=1 Tax=Companilactobacillus kimchii DSM 13961 = JCM 10707 TaxID=1423765 RepID=A0ABR5NWP9_9LACO|nr:hypothetical protein FC97_GL000013 [Companilactobacillus kimchii DSM 13961 = JCM 10707]
MVVKRSLLSNRTKKELTDLICQLFLFNYLDSFASRPLRKSRTACVRARFSAPFFWFTGRRWPVIPLCVFCDI